jgi:hypothetical protein
MRGRIIGDRYYRQAAAKRMRLSIFFARLTIAAGRRGDDVALPRTLITPKVMKLSTLARVPSKGSAQNAPPAVPGFAIDLENAVSFNVSNIKAMGVAIIGAVLLAIGSPTIALAATKEEVSRCRAIDRPIQRRECFESLKKRPKPKAEEATKAKTPPPTDVPATTYAVDHLGVTPGWPLCVDRDTLAAILAASVLASSLAETTTNGCQTIPENAKVELLERYPNALRFLRVIKVKVTSPALPDSTAGFTIEIGR